MIEYHSNNAIKTSSFRSSLLKAFLPALLAPVLLLGAVIIFINTSPLDEQLAVITGGSPYGLLIMVFAAILLAGIIAVALAAGAARRISAPIIELADSAVRMSDGDVELQMEIDRDDEIGLLAQALNQQALQIHTITGSMEERVLERTRELEKQSSYLKATVELSRALSSILDFDTLAREVVELIRQHFGLYFVGLFLVNEDSQWAVLHAGTGPAGMKLIEQGHKVEMGSGIVGLSIENNKPRIASEAMYDAARLGTPELPLTRSEAALPLRSHGHIIGALSAKSEKLTTFDELTVSVLQVMADQVAAALENARLIKENREAQEAVRRTYSQTSKAAWADLLQRGPVGYRCDASGVAPVLPSESDPIAVSDDPRLRRMPIVVRGQHLGTIEAVKPADSGAWTKDEISVMNTLVDQLSIALDNARLYSETRLRAERERMISDITSKVRASTNLDTILQTSIAELAQALNISRGRILIRGIGGVDDRGARKDEEHE